jgi:lipopolysaccharide/colanic/teichoic acid biosynthesis glycosyltransferase
MTERSWRFPPPSPRGLLPLELGTADAVAAYLRRLLALILAASVALTFIGIYVAIYKLGMRSLPLLAGIVFGICVSLFTAILEGQHKERYSRLQLRLLQLPQALRSAIERLLAFLALLISAPTFLVIALLVRLDSKGPVFVRMTRVGRFGRPFSRLTFRTLKLQQEKYDERVPRSKAHTVWKVTRIGGVLRHSSLDKLPMLINVAKGEMTLFGDPPRAPDDLLASGALYLPSLLWRPGVMRIQHRSDWSPEVPPHLSNVAAYLRQAITDHRYEENTKLFLMQIKRTDMQANEAAFVLTCWVAAANEPEIRGRLKELGVSSVDVISGSARQSAALIEAAWTAWCDLPHRQEDEPLDRLVGRQPAGS